MTAIDKYFDLMQARPDLFTDSRHISIVTDRETLEAYAGENGKDVGVVYEGFAHLLVVDLIRGEDGCHYTYERMVPIARGRGVVCIPVYEDQFVLLRQYRHTIREYQVCFPRGFGETGLTAEENARKELAEEIGAVTGKCKKLGSITADSGLTSGWTDVFVCRVEAMEAIKHTEGIDQIILCTREELEEQLRRGEITDSFTLCAWQLLGEKEI